MQERKNTKKKDEEKIEFNYVIKKFKVDYHENRIRKDISQFVQ